MLELVQIFPHKTLFVTYIENSIKFAQLLFDLTDSPNITGDDVSQFSIVSLSVFLSLDPQHTELITNYVLQPKQPVELMVEGVPFMIDSASSLYDTIIILDHLQC